MRLTDGKFKPFNYLSPPVKRSSIQFTNTPRRPANENTVYKIYNHQGIGRIIEYYAIVNHASPCEEVVSM